MIGGGGEGVNTGILKHLQQHTCVNTLTLSVSPSHLYWISSSTACWGILRSALTLPRCRVKYIKLLNNAHISNTAFALFVLLCCFFFLNAAVIPVWIQMQVTKGQTVMDRKPGPWKQLNVLISTSWMNKQINRDGIGVKFSSTVEKTKLVFTIKSFIFWQWLYITIIWIQSMMLLPCFFLMM